MAALKKSLKDPDILNELCERLIAGEGIKTICADPHMPNAVTVYRAMQSEPEIATRIAHAREAQQDALADDLIRMADDATAEDWQVVKLKIATRQWHMSKLAPKKYGDRLHLDAKIEEVDIAEKQARIMELLGKARGDIE